jgi:flagellar basal-body rod protein FlgC
MNLFDVFSVSASGMGAQRARMNVVAGNLANVETTRSPEGGPYRRRNIVFRAVAAGRGAGLVPAALPPFGSAASVEVAGVQESPRPPRRVYEPHHPDADAAGYVAYPDINTIEEMVDLMAAVRSYEANLAAFNATKALVRRLLEIGRV